MILLFDTHSFIWWASDPDKMSKQALEACRDQSNTLLLSVASVWEMQIKVQIGKLQLNKPLREIVADQGQLNNVQLLPITANHVLELDNLPFHHKDPFDRLIIAQSFTEFAIILTTDNIFRAYTTSILW